MKLSVHDLATLRCRDHQVCYRFIPEHHHTSPDTLRACSACWALHKKGCKGCECPV